MLDLQLGRMVVIDDPNLLTVKGVPDRWFLSQLTRLHCGPTLYGFREAQKSKGRFIRLDQHDDALYLMERQDCFAVNRDFQAVLDDPGGTFTAKALTKQLKCVGESAYDRLCPAETHAFDCDHLVPGVGQESNHGFVTIHQYWRQTDITESLQVSIVNRFVTIYWGFEIDPSAVNII